MKKDIDWLKEEIWKQDIVMDKGYIYTDDLMSIINEVDELEVLSEEWIDENKAYFDNWMPAVPIIHLRNLLVPKQELPVIPKFVAEWIEEVKPDNSLRVAFEYIAQRKRDNHDDELAFWVEEGNSETFARAWLDGYEVEKEQKYRVSLHDGTWLVSDDNKNISKATTYFMHQEDGGFMNRTHEFTEQQINNVDTKYMAFAVKVEELEK